MLHPLFQVLLSFGADPNHYAITGSASLYLRRMLPREPNDLDVIARGPAWDTFASQATPTKVEPFGSLRLSIPTIWGEIEIFDEWLGDRRKTIELICHAEIISADRFLLPLVPVEEVIRYKSKLGREKDKFDLMHLQNSYHNIHV